MKVNKTIFILLFLINSSTHPYSLASQLNLAALSLPSSQNLTLAATSVAILAGAGGVYYVASAMKSINQKIKNLQEVKQDPGKLITVAEMKNPMGVTMMNFEGNPGRIAFLNCYICDENATIKNHFDDIYEKNKEAIGKVLDSNNNIEAMQSEIENIVVPHVDLTLIDNEIAKLKASPLYRYTASLFAPIGE